jgi:hypothetical protein
MSKAISETFRIRVWSEDIAYCYSATPSESRWCKYLRDFFGPRCRLFSRMLKKKFKDGAVRAQRCKECLRMTNGDFGG